MTSEAQRANKREALDALKALRFDRKSERNHNLVSVSSEPVQNIKTRDLTLNGLPLEVLSHVLSFLDPPNICTLRQCCKLLKKASKQRVVWYHALRRAIFQLGAFEASFPLETMSAAELEYAATANYRFCWKIRNEPKPSLPELPLHPMATRILRLPHTCKGNEKQRGYIRSILNVPGLRFLLVVSEHDLSFWDMGYIGQSAASLHIREVTSLALPDNAVFPVCKMTISKYPSTKIILGLRNSNHVNNCSTFSVYVVDLFSEEPSFVWLNTLDASLNVWKWHLTPNMLIYYDSLRKCMVAWRFMEDMVARWMHGDEGVNKIFTIGDNIVLVDRTIQVLGPSLEFRPRSDVLNVDPQSNQTVLRCTLPYNTHQIIQCGGNNYDVRPENATLTVLGARWRSEETGLFCYNFKALPDAGELADCPRIMALENRKRTTVVPGFMLGKYAEETHFNLLHLPNDRQLIHWPSDEGVCLYASCLKNSSARRVEEACAILHKFNIDPDDFTYDLDLLSGRLSVVQSCNEVVLYDFV